jgi:hypothetical protein
MTGLGALSVFCPVMAASILVYREGKTTSVADLLKRSFDCFLRQHWRRVALLWHLWQCRHRLDGAVS